MLSAAAHRRTSIRDFHANVFHYAARVTTSADPETNSAQHLRPQEGLAALHLFYRLDLAAWRVRDETDRAVSLDFLETLITTTRQQEQTQVITLSMMTPADIGFMILTPDLHDLNALEKSIASALGPNVLIPEFSFLSMTEKSEYTQKEEDYAREIEEKEGIKRGTKESEEKLVLFRERIRHYTHDRLYPVLPNWEYFCFYPMNKRRDPGQNWYALPYDKRRELMAGHMKVGRTYSGRVRQLVTGSTGLDDWEWGVTLFAHDPYEIKAIVYEMRFDEVSHTYGEFGPFYNGLPLPLKEIYSRLQLY